MKESSIDQKTVWNDAARSGLVLGGVSSAYMLCTSLAGMIHGGTAMTVLVNIGGVLLWVAKLYLCIYLMKLFMTRFAASHEGALNHDSYRFGVATALLSALVYSAFYLAWVSFIQPDMFSASFDAARELYSDMLSADQLSAFDELLPKMPTYSFFLNFFWCFLFGTVLSAILSRNIPSRNPFADSLDQED